MWTYGADTVTDRTSSVVGFGRPVEPVARHQDRVELLWRLRARRRELIDALAAGLADDEPLSPSSVEPLATIQGAIEAVEAEVGEGDPVPAAI